MYLLDANVFIQAKNLHYGFDFCPAFWDWLSEAHSRGSVFSIDKVRDELLAGDDELAAWAAPLPATFFLKPDAAVLTSLQVTSSWVIGAGYEPAAVSTFLQVGDSYLVAHGHALGWTVVTHEVVSAGMKKIKIPNACIALGVRFVTPYEMLRAERARFVLPTFGVR